jgi:predicted tellurium resistance membrane protein TerC
MNRHAWIVWLGGGLLGYVAGEMLSEDPLVKRWLGEGLRGWLEHAVPIGIGAAVTALGWWLGRSRRRPR